MEQKLNTRIQNKFGDMPKYMQPGNVGNINNVLWPFWFSFSAPMLAPNTGSNAHMTVTQEAAFIWMAMSKVVFKLDGNQYKALNPYTDPTFSSQADGLKYSIRDAQSSRIFHGVPSSVDNVGVAEFPTVLSTPQLLLPNSTLEIIYQNSNATETFVPFITLFGYRIRLEDAQKMLGTITG